MTGSTNEEIFARHSGRSAPLLPILHEFHDRDGHLSEAALRAVSHELRTPLADLFGTVTFYHHFSREPGGLDGPRVCTGPICRMNGAEDLLASIDGAVPMPCSGRCDEPIPVLRGHETLVGLSAQGLEYRPSPLPAPAPEGVRECVFRSIREPGNAGLSTYEASGGYEALRKAMAGMSPSDLIREVEESGLAGRGGAGFPTGTKWKAVADAEGHPKTIVCNADEGEPGCFKDRAIMDHDPHAVIEGMTLAGYATGASRGFIYLRYEYPETLDILNSALDEASTAGLVGMGVLGTDFDFDLRIIRGAGAYICGEETSLLNSMEGKHPFPRNRPPYPVTHGLEDLPTAVNNVETLASIPHIIREGSEWYRGLGRGDHVGTKIISLSGDVARPGNYEVPLGLPLMELIDEWAGGMRSGHSIQAVTMAGLSGGFLAGEDLDVTLDEPSIRSRGSFLGAGGIMVFDDSRDMIEIARQAMVFFAHESCGKCFPCRIGTQRLSERLAGKAGPDELSAWLDEVGDLGSAMKETSACGLGMAAPLIAESLVRYFPEQISEHVEGRRS
jgi:NADH-quinone oxidoreductase subunit F